MYTLKILPFLWKCIKYINALIEEIQIFLTHNLSCFFKTFYFEIITDSQKVTKIIGRSSLPFTQCLLMVTFHIIIAKYQNKENNIGTVYVCTYVCIYIYNCSMPFYHLYVCEATKFKIQKCSTITKISLVLLNLQSHFPSSNHL